ncbi:MAG: RNA-guided endonuclease InsQ/TnpB family protein [Thermodesulfobacteriota bacterium]
MLVRKSFQFRLYPTKKQARALQGQLDECRWLYNELLEQRKVSHEELDHSLSKYEQSMFLPLLKEERPSLSRVHSQVLQNVVDRLDKAFQGFFRRCKAGEMPGFPRFRGVHRYNSFCYPQSGFSLVGDKLKLSKLGPIRVKMHRPAEGEIKICTLRMNASGDWDVSLSCEVDVTPLPPKEEAVGIDMGLEYFATLSNGQDISNPRFFQREEAALAKAQRKLAKFEKGASERRKQGKVVAKIHERIGNQRKDFCHKESKKIIDQYQYICVEDLNIKKMVEGSHFAKNITDASWNQFRQFLTYKAAEAGRKLGLVNPAYTTQDCYQCGYRAEKKLSERMHDCSQCGYRATRDLNAAQNILALGLDGLGVIPRSPRL